MTERGFVHDNAFYASDAEFHDLLLGHLEPALTTGEPVILAYDEATTTRVRDWLPTAADVTFLSGRTLYDTPARTIAVYRRMFAERVAAGATRIRVAGEVPHEGNGGCFTGWDRYEAAVNKAWDEFPVHGLCLYDATATAPETRAVVERTHTHTRTSAHTRRPNPRFAEPAAFRPLAQRPDPLTAAEPLVELTDPTPVQARHAVTTVASDRFAGHVVDDLRIGVSETIANARRHGSPSTTVRLWADASRVVVHVTDGGTGPADPLAGLFPSDTTGLWLVHQLDLDVALVDDRVGFTVRLRTRPA